jgi:hypothetical protein
VRLARTAAVVAALAAAAPSLAAGAAPVTVATTVSPAAVVFGDTAVLEVQALVDAGVVDPGTVRLEADAAPLERVGSVERDAWRDGDLAHVRFRVTVACAQLACLTRAPAALRVVARGSSGANFDVRRDWPALVVGRRVPADATQPRADGVPRPVRWRVGPTALLTALLVLALALAGAAVAFAAAEVLRARAARGRGDTRLARALAAVRRALGGDERARRRAAGQLARALEPADGALALAAGELAWSSDPPGRDALARLADRVEEEHA